MLWKKVSPLMVAPRASCVRQRPHYCFYARGSEDSFENKTCSFIMDSFQAVHKKGLQEKAIVLAYSNFGRTYILYAVSSTSLERRKSFCRNRPTVLHAVNVMILMCLFHNLYLEKNTPMQLYEQTLSMRAFFSMYFRYVKGRLGLNVTNLLLQF